jgi:hypothetical protein
LREVYVNARLETNNGSARIDDGTTDLGNLAAHALTARVDEVDGQQGVILDDGDDEIGLSEAFGHREAIVRGYKRAAMVLLARAAMLDAEGEHRNRGET